MGDPFAEAFSDEIRYWINIRRKARGLAEAAPDRIQASNELVGIAFSGGGMRSATFSLGVAQALARKGLLAEADYISTVSGGGYFGTALTALCAEPLPYPTAGDRLGVTPGSFPFGFPGPRRPLPPAGEPAPVEGLESPALRHVRENTHLITHAPGLLDADTWTGLARYLSSTMLLWALFLLPLVTLGYLISMFIPVEAWARFDPLNIDGATPTWISGHLWVLTAPLWPLAGVALLAMCPAWGARWPETFLPRPIRYLQQLLLTVAAVTGAAVLLMLGVWVMHLALSIEGGLQGLAKGVFAGAGIGGAAAAGISARWMSLPGSATRLLPRIGLAVGGYVLLGFAAVSWYYFLWRWVYPSPDSLRVFAPDSPQEWRFFTLALGTSAALVLLTMIAGTRLLNFLSLLRLYEQQLRRTWVISARPALKSQLASLDAASWRKVWVRPDLTVGGIGADSANSTTPYPLWVASVNISGSTGTTLLDRKSDGFTIAPLYCGSNITKWRPTRDMPTFWKMRLSVAASVSGAVVSPNMGMSTHPTLAIVMTLFNIRLGMWVNNPRRPQGAMDRLVGALHRVFGLYWNELVGRASYRGPWVYLSDGGHFDNLGLYELLRRRCKYVIAVDATGEPTGAGPLNFGGIGIPLRLARTDFGVEVDIDLTGLARDPVTGFAKSYFAVGRIRYPKAGGGHGNPDDPNDPDTGYLVLIKSGLKDHTLPPDIVNYLRQENTGFPHDSTADQQFSQPQFESYRQLGFIAGNEVTRAAGAGPSVRQRFDALAESYRKSIA